MTLIRAGWISFVRLHGVHSAHGPNVVLPIDLRGSAEFVCVDFRIVLDEELTIPVNFPGGNWLAVEGGPDPKPRHSTTIRGDDPQGIWMQIVLARDYEIDSGLAQRFRDGRGEGVSEIDALLGETIDRELEDYGVLVSAAAVASLERAQPHMRAMGRVYWWSGDKYAIRVLQKVSVTVVPAQVLTHEQLLAITATAAPLLVHGGEDANNQRTPLAVAARWLLTVSDLPMHSNERFIVYFQALEALTRRADGSPDAEVVGAFEQLEGLVAGAEESVQTAVRGLLDRVKENSLGPSLRERFGRLARQFNPKAADEDIAAFAAMTRLRNDLVHARRTRLPTTFKNYVVEDTLRRLAFFYFDRLAKALSAAYSVTRPG